MLQAGEAAFFLAIFAACLLMIFSTFLNFLAGSALKADDLFNSRSTTFRVAAFFSFASRRASLRAPARCSRNVEFLESAVFRADASEGPSRRFPRSEEHTSELQSLMRIPYAVFFL